MERFRRHLWNPEVLVYDESYERVVFIVARTKSEEQLGIIAAPPEANDEWDLPF
jgi:hypothetical protein